MSIVDEMKPHVREYMEQKVRYKFEEFKSYFDNGSEKQSDKAAENFGIFWTMLVKYGIDINEIVDRMFADDVIDNYEELTKAGASIDITEWFPHLTADCAFDNLGFLREKGIESQEIFNLMNEQSFDVTKRGMTQWLEEKVNADDVYKAYEDEIFDKDAYHILWDLDTLNKYGLTEEAKDQLKNTIRNQEDVDLYENIAKEKEQWAKLGVKFEDYIKDYIRLSYSSLIEDGPREFTEGVGMSFEDLLENMDFKAYNLEWTRHDDLKNIDIARRFVNECLEETGTVEIIAKKMVDNVGYKNTNYADDVMYYALLEKGTPDLDATRIVKAAGNGHYLDTIFGLPRKEVLKTYRKSGVKRLILKYYFPARFSVNLIDIIAWEFMEL